MAGITVTTTLGELEVLFNKAKEVYYKKTELTAADLGEESLTVDMELPVLEDGLTLNTGEVEVTEIKLTTGTIWTSRATKGDSDITLQVASIDGAVNDLFMNAIANKGITGTSGGILTGKTFSGKSYSLAPKKVTGSLIFMSEDRQTIIALPKVEMYANLVAADGDNPAYFNVSVTPKDNSEGADIMIMNDSAAA